MRHRLSCPAAPVSGPGHQPRTWRLAAGGALATAAVLALAAIACLRRVTAASRVARRSAWLCSGPPNEGPASLDSLAEAGAL